VPSGRRQYAVPHRLTFVFRHDQCVRFDESYVLERATLPVGLHTMRALVCTWLNRQEVTREWRKMRTEELCDL